MKKAKLFWVGFILMGFLKGFSQTTSTSIIDSGAKYSNYVEYNSGEVFVVFNIPGTTIISKTDDGLESLSDNAKIRIYPNPVNDILRIIPPNDKNVSKIILSNMDGKVVIEDQVNNNQIDLSRLPSGIYVLKTDLSDTEIFKVIKP